MLAADQPDVDLDMQVRLAAFAHLAELTRGRDDQLLPGGLLREGFTFRGQQVGLTGVQGIFKPALLPEMPLSIRSAARVAGQPAPYEDTFSVEGERLLYKYEGRDMDNPRNRGLRRAMQRRRPLIYFHGVVNHEYLAAWPVYVVADEPSALRFHIALDEERYIGDDNQLTAAEDSATGRRAYLTRTLQVRLHQRSFRERVLGAYRRRCALCRLRREALLDAAHITPDADPRGAPVVENGLALCKLHHAAFDRNLIGIRPDKVVIVRRDVLEEQDGPMLIHGLQQFHKERILLPRNITEHPDPERLQQRYELFLENAAG